MDSVTDKPTVFIDGEAGTTGLQIAERLRGREDLELLKIDPALRKAPQERQRLLNACDIAVLCLPDAAARESVSLITNPKVRVLDASTAHRVDPQWTYGFAELTPGQRPAIRNAKRVSNPGCYATGCIALLRPLVDAGLISAKAPLTLNAVSGYSGGGRSMIERFESGKGVSHGVYGLSLGHKHLPEMRVHSGLATDPLFVPSVGSFRCGMLVMVPLSGLDLNAEGVHQLWTERYQGEAFVQVLPVADESVLGSGFLEPQALNGSNRLELIVFGRGAQTLLIARLDNLGKGASGAAVQNLNIMLGVNESRALQ